MTTQVNSPSDFLRCSDRRSHLHHRCGFSRFFVCIAQAALVCILSMAPALSKAQTTPDRIAAVMAVINQFVLETGTFEVELNAKQISSVVIDRETKIIFADQSENTDFCFVVNRNLELQAGQLTIFLNDEELMPAPVVGENCYTFDPAGLLEENIVSFQLSGVGAVSAKNITLDPSQQSALTMSSLTRRTWDNRAVRKVLRIFAFGGHATHKQIQTWADMRPNDAISEMLNFEEHNLKLSPLAQGEEYPISASNYGTLTQWLNFLSDETHFDHPIPQDRREQYGLNSFNFDDGFNRMVTVRGLNPFRQKIGFWETNYHLALNLETSVTRPQMAHFFDLIMEAHAAGLPYHQVLGEAAKSAAVAMQYAHRFNVWDEFDGMCLCNEDFAREIHQLYYGIFGEGVAFHEDVTIPETAKMLTDMEVRYNGDLLGGYPLDVNFQTEQHHTAGVYIFKDVDGSPNVFGTNAAEKIDALMPMSMQHPESLQNLPIMIIEVLADDNLSDASKNQLRTAWASMGVDRVFLDFIHAYAVSDLFHGPQQFKYMTTHERALYIANRNNLDNLEAYFGGASYNGRAGRTVGSVVSEDLAGDFFEPLHNVFGGQTSLEASDSTLVFEKNYNRVTERESDIRDAVGCATCNNGSAWEKKWASVLPQRNDGQYYVADVAEWLWLHVVGDMSKYTLLEQAHLHSLLGAARVDPGFSSDGDHALDFQLVMCAIRDYEERESPPSLPSIVNDILTDGANGTNSPWDDYCRGSDDGTDGYLDYERAYIDGAISLQQIESTGDGYFTAAEFQSVINELGEVTLPLLAAGPQHHEDGATLRKHARERINFALHFIFATPFVFAEAN